MVISPLEVFVAVVSDFSLKIIRIKDLLLMSEPDVFSSITLTEKVATIEWNPTHNPSTGKKICIQSQIHIL
jgi:hypothetical protein